MGKAHAAAGGRGIDRGVRGELRPWAEAPGLGDNRGEEEYQIMQGTMAGVIETWGKGPRGLRVGVNGTVPGR